ncbi:MAG: hypothetical protein AAFY91_00045 [Bacteroidota bacterium]
MNFNIITLFTLTICLLSSPLSIWSQIDDLGGFKDYLEQEEIELIDIIDRLKSYGIDSTDFHGIPVRGQVNMVFERVYNLPEYAQVIFQIGDNSRSRYFFEIIYRGEYWMSLTLSRGEKIVIYRSSDLWEKMKSDWDAHLEFESLQNQNFSQLSLSELGRVGTACGAGGSCTSLIATSLNLIENQRVSVFRNWAVSLCPELRTVGLAGLYALLEDGYDLDAYDLELIRLGEQDVAQVYMCSGCTQFGIRGYQVKDFFKQVAGYFIYFSNPRKYDRVLRRTLRRQQ